MLSEQEMMTLRFLVHIAKRYLCDNNDRNYNCKHIFAEALIYFEWYCFLLIVQQDTERKAINQEEHQPHNKEMRSTNLVFCPFSLYSLLSKHIPVFFFLLFLPSFMTSKTVLFCFEVISVKNNPRYFSTT